MDIGSLTGEVALTDNFSSTLGVISQNIKTFDSSANGLSDSIINGIKNPMDAAKNAAVGFAEELGPLGISVIAVGTVAVATGTALFELATRAASVGASLDDMSDKTGLSVPALSRLSNAAQVIGADMGQLTNTVFMLQRGIGTNSEAFQAGLAKMGLSTAELKAVGPDRYLELVTAGLRNIPDTSDRAAAGMAVLGRQYKSVAASLMDLDAGFKATADLTPWTAAQAHEAEVFEQQIASIETHVRAAAIAVGYELIPAFSLFISAIERVGIAIINVSGIPGYIKLFDALKGAIGETRLAEQSLGASTDTANRLWAASGATSTSVAKAMLDLGYSVETVTMHSGLGAKAVAGLSGAMVTARHEADSLDSAWERLNALESSGIPSLNGLSTSTKDLVTHYQALGASVGDITLATGVSAAQQALLTEAHKKGETAAEKLEDAHRKLVEAITAVNRKWAETDAGSSALTMTQKDLVLSYLAVGREVDDIATKLGVSKIAVKAYDDELKDMVDRMADVRSEALKLKPVLGGIGFKMLREDVTLLKGTFNEFHDGITVAGDTITKVTIPMFSSLPNVVAQATDAIDDATTSVKSLGHGLKTDLLETLQQIPGTIVSSLTGGGGLLGAGKAIGSMLGASIGESIGKSISSATTGLGSLAGPIGAALGSLVGPLVGLVANLFGPSAAEKANREAQSSMVTGLNNIATAAEKAEIATAEGGDAYKTIAVVGRDAFLSVGYSAEQAEVYVKGLLNTKDTAQYNAAAKALTAAQTAATSVQTAVTAVTTAAGKLGVVLPASMKASITELLKLNTLTEAEKTSLQDVLDAAEPDYASLTSMAANYGITLEGLGPQFQQANIEETAKGIYDDFTALTDAGADAGGVTLGMSDKILQLVEDSRKFGTAIPDNMKPLIQSMEDSGELSDEFKSKLGNIADMKFEATPLDQGLKSLQDTLNDLIDTLKTLPGAVSSVTGATTSAASPASTGGRVTSSGVVYAAEGANILSTVFAAQGTDTVPAMLTPGERVLSVAQNAAYEKGTTVTVPVYLDGRKITEVIVPLIPAELRRRGAA